MHSHGAMAGPAATVRTPPGDNLMLHKAIDLAAPGDILVVDAAGDLTHAVMGELMLAHAIQRGIAGFVINGAIRDSEAFVQRNLPTYAAGITHLGPYKNGPGEINVPVSLDGMVIHPGDLILGDADGVVCVPREQCNDVYHRASSKHKAELEQLERISVGRNNREWVDEALRKAGYDFTQ
jgi:regulator of RNase E activity RraA